MNNETTVGQLLDNLLSTEDKGFTDFIQTVIAQSKGHGKFIPEVPILDYMVLLYDVYHFCLENNKKPYACIEYILTETKEENYSENELIFFLDSISEILFNSSKWDEIQLVHVQLVSLRDDIKPILEEADVKNFCADFYYDLLEEKLQEFSQPVEKIDFIKDRLRLLEEKWTSLHFFEKMFIEDMAFVTKCVNEIERQTSIIDYKATAAKASLPNKSAKVTQGQLAFFYYYLHEKGCRARFPEGDKEKAYREATDPHGLAWKPFQMKYNSLQKTSNRLANNNIEALSAVIPMLEQYPKAQQLAKDELAIAKSRKPLT